MVPGGWSLGLSGRLESFAFLRARWEHLCLLQYPVPAELLKPHVPPGLTLDLFDGQPHVSLVAFDFNDTRVLGIPWPGYRFFPEINLRFYVRDGEQRGVTFVKEYVPQSWVAWLARTLYNEPYQAAPMRSSVEDTPEGISIAHVLEVGGKKHRLHVTANKPMLVPDASSMEHFFKEHEWGFGQSGRGEKRVYRVQHPQWDVYTDVVYNLSWDWGLVYGEKWAFLNDVEPSSVVVARGSEVSVSPWTSKLPELSPAQS